MDPAENRDYLSPVFSINRFRQAKQGDTMDKALKQKAESFSALNWPRCISLSASLHHGYHTSNWSVIYRQKAQSEYNEYEASCPTRNEQDLPQHTLKQKT